jgi:hypothetical protein
MISLPQLLDMCATEALETGGERCGCSGESRKAPEIGPNKPNELPPIRYNLELIPTEKGYEWRE